jgi:hypothetical protein
MKHLVLVFVDGLGWGGKDPARNPLAHPACGFLRDLYETYGKRTNACLGISGLPQSATGQTALLTGTNAAQVIGRHREGFPNEALRRIIRNNNVFSQLLSFNLKVTFANAYQRQRYADIPHRSVTTVATFSAIGKVRGLGDLRRGRAVYQDITNRYLIDQGHAVPLITPEQAGENLAGIVRLHHFTLFEYFKTDRAGHSQDLTRALAVLLELQCFLAVLTGAIDRRDTLFILTSDHGNIEDLAVKTHTCNPVPTAAVGLDAAGFLAGVESITDLTPAIVRFFTGTEA